MMSRALRYLCLFIVAIATINCSAESDSAITQTLANLPDTSISTYQFEFPLSELAICTSRQLPTTAPYRYYNSGKRQNSGHRNNYDFVKSGKIINNEIINSTLTSNLIASSSFTRPASRLAALGKLII